MIDESEFELNEKDFNFDQVEFYDVEVNSPITEEDIRYAMLEDIIFKENFPCNINKFSIIFSS